MGRSSINRTFQIGVETTQGTQVPGNKLFSGISVNLSTNTTVKEYRAAGFKYNTTSILERIWSQGTYDGPLSYDEVLYPLSSLFGLPTATTPTGGTLSRQWVFTPTSRGADPIKTFTVEDGDATAAQVSTNVAFKSMDLNFATDEVKISGNLIGRTPSVSTLTASPTILPQVILSSNQLDVYMATSLGTATAGVYSSFLASGNKVASAYMEKFSMGDKLDPRFVHNTSFQSFVDLIEKPPSLAFTFSTEHNAQSRALFASALSNTFQYIGIVATGPIIEGSINYIFEIIVACNVVPGAMEDAAGVYGFNYKCTPIYDATLGAPMRIRCINTTTAL